MVFRAGEKLIYLYGNYFLLLILIIFLLPVRRLHIVEIEITTPEALNIQ